MRSRWRLKENYFYLGWLVHRLSLNLEEFRAKNNQKLNKLDKNHCYDTLLNGVFYFVPQIWPDPWMEVCLGCLICHTNWNLFIAFLSSLDPGSVLHFGSPFLLQKGTLFSPILSDWSNKYRIEDEIRDQTEDLFTTLTQKSQTYWKGKDFIAENMRYVHFCLRGEVVEENIKKYKVKIL